MGSPVLFRQERAGRDGKPFTLVKFRTMRVPRPGEEDPTHDGARLTRIGRLLRDTSLDELPTFWNVAKGDMSLVGPRPLPTSYLSRYTERQARRHDVKPGITGWCQINGRNSNSWADKLEFDLWYIDHRAATLDLRILGLTVAKVLRRDGVTASDHPTMPEFLGDQGG